MYIKYCNHSRPLISLPSLQNTTHHPHQSLSQIHGLGLILWLTRFNQGYQCGHWFGTMHRSLMGSPMEMYLKAMIPCLNRREQIVQQWETGPSESLLQPCLTWAEPVPVSSAALGGHGCDRSGPVLPRRQHFTVLLPITWLVESFLLFFHNVPFAPEELIQIIYFRLSTQLSLILSTLCRYEPPRKHCCSLEREDSLVNIYMYKHKYLEGQLDPVNLVKQWYSVPMSPLLCFFFFFNPVYSTRHGFSLVEQVSNPAREQLITHITVVLLSHK